MMLASAMDSPSCGMMMGMEGMFKSEDGRWKMEDGEEISFSILCFPFSFC
jgi:hypothetical protein